MSKIKRFIQQDHFDELNHWLSISKFDIQHNRKKTIKIYTKIYVEQLNVACYKTNISN